MKTLIFSIFLMSQFGMAARITGTKWYPASRAVAVSLAYQGGCLAHEFDIQWDACTRDPVSNHVTRFGLVVDSGGGDTCQVEQVSTVISWEPHDGCFAESLILKSSSSKTTVVIPK